MFILDRSIGVFWHCAEEERRWRARPPQRQSCLSATTCSKPSRGWSSDRFLSHAWKHLFLDVVDELPLRPGHRHPSASSFSLSTNDILTTNWNVSKVSSVPFPTSKLKLLSREFITTTAAAAAAAAEAEKLKGFGNTCSRRLSSSTPGHDRYCINSIDHSNI